MYEWLTHVFLFRSTQVCSTTKWQTYFWPCTVWLMFSHAQAQILLSFWIRLDGTCCFVSLFVYMYMYMHMRRQSYCIDVSVCTGGKCVHLTNYAPLTTTPVISFQAEVCPPSLLLSSKMKLLLSLAVLVVTLGVLNSTPEDEPISEDTLKRKFTELNFFQSNLYQCLGRIWLSSSPMNLSLYNEFYKIVYRYIISVDLCNSLLFVESVLNVWVPCFDCCS